MAAGKCERGAPALRGADRSAGRGRRAGARLMKIVVDRNPPEPDMSQVPTVLRPLRPLPSAAELAALPFRAQWRPLAP